MKAYTKLRMKMVEQDIRSIDIATLLNRSESYVSHRMSGKIYYWDLNEAYMISTTSVFPTPKLQNIFRLTRVCRRKGEKPLNVIMKEEVKNDV